MKLLLILEMTALDKAKEQLYYPGRHKHTHTDHMFILWCATTHQSLVRLKISKPSIFTSSKIVASKTKQQQQKSTMMKISNVSKLFFRLILILLACERMNLGMESPKNKLNALKASADLLLPQLPLCQPPNFLLPGSPPPPHVDINTSALFGCDVYPRILSKSLLYPRIFLTSPLYRRICIKVSVRMSSLKWKDLSL